MIKVYEGLNGEEDHLRSIKDGRILQARHSRTKELETFAFTSRIQNSVTSIVAKITANEQQRR